MKITNNLKLPQPFVDAVSSDYKYKEKRYSVTTLLKPTREIILQRRHNDEIEQDVSDMIWSIFGTAVHSVLENSTEGKHLLSEKSLEIQVGDYTLSGRSDLYNTRSFTVIDYKVTSVWKYILKDFEDYRLQGLMYVYMLKQLGYKAKKAEFVLVLKDWQKSKAKFDKTYPQFPVQKVQFSFVDDDFVFIEKFIKDKFEEIRQAEQLADDELPICSAEDRWNSGDKFAVMKNGRKTALRVLDSMEDAEKYKAENGGDYIETRKGEDKKCQEYCLCCEFCKHYKECIKNSGSQPLPF